MLDKNFLLMYHNEYNIGVLFLIPSTKIHANI